MIVLNHTLKRLIDEDRYPLSPRCAHSRRFSRGCSRRAGPTPLPPRKHYEPPSKVGIADADEALPRPADDPRQCRRGACPADGLV